VPKRIVSMDDRPISMLRLPVNHVSQRSDTTDSRRFVEPETGGGATW
jgi:hypothetical protein